MPQDDFAFLPERAISGPIPTDWADLPDTLKPAFASYVIEEAHYLMDGHAEHWSIDTPDAEIADTWRSAIRRALRRCRVQGARAEDIFPYVT